MKKLIALSICAVIFAFSPQVIASTSMPTNIKNDVVEHGGGCRKDSPTGQCCHAGSKPYHCH